MVWTLSQVALGGALGSVARYLAVLSAARLFGAGWPFGTFCVNIAGSFVMGLAFVVLAQRGPIAPLVMAGFLGGFTTFSAFSLDSLKMWQAGAFVPLAAYIGLSVALSLIACALGAALAKGLT